MKTAESDAFAQSRWLGLCAGGMVLPFLLAAPAAKPIPLLLIMAALLLPSAAALLALRLQRSSAALTQALVSFGIAAAFLFSGVGPACALALLALAFIDFEIHSASRPFSWRQAIAAAAMSAAFWIVASQFAQDAAPSAGIASLALLPPLVQVGFALQALKTRSIGKVSTATETHALLAATLKHGRETALLLDRSGRVLTLGPNAQPNLGAMAHELLGRGLFERLHVLDRPALLKLCAEITPQSPEQIVKLRLRLDPPHAQTRLVSFVDLDARIIAPEDSVDDLLVFLSKSSSAAGERATGVSAQVEVSERYLTEINHYIRTPLNAVIGFADLLSSPATQPKEPGTIAEYGEIIRESGQTLLRVTDTLVDMVRLKSGTYLLAPQMVDPALVVRAAEEYLRDYFGEKRLTLSIESVEIDGDWFADRSAAIAIVAGTAAAIMDVAMTLSSRIRVVSAEARIRFECTPMSAAVQLPDGGLRQKLSPKCGLLFEQAQALASYQGGAVKDRMGSDGGFAAEITLPMTLAADDDANAPVSLDRFRRGKDDQSRNRSETVIKRHA